MGYRHSLKVVKIKDFKLIDQKLINFCTDSEGWFNRYKLFEQLNFVEVIELGKYSDEGFELSKREHKIRKLEEQFKLAFENCKDVDSDFNLVTQEDLLWLVEQYKDRTVSYWESLLSDEPLETYGKHLETVSEKCEYYIKDLLHWSKFLIHTDLKDKWTLQTTWKYEYELFNLLHIYKTVNWKKELLFIVGG